MAFAAENNVERVEQTDWRQDLHKCRRSCVEQGPAQARPLLLPLALPLFVSAYAVSLNFFPTSLPVAVSSDTLRCRCPCFCGTSRCSESPMCGCQRVLWHVPKRWMCGCTSARPAGGGGQFRLLHRGLTRDSAFEPYSEWPKPFLAAASLRQRGGA